MINKESLYDWVFHYNHHTELWNVFQRKDYVEYFNNSSDPNLVVIKSKDIKSLINILYKIGGDEAKIADL